MISKEKWKVYKNVFSEASIRKLWKLSTQGYFQELESPLLLGKEANVFTALTKNNERIIVKIYRLENCNFNKMWQYIAADNRYMKLKKAKREIVYGWTQREFRNMSTAYMVCRVPKPIAFSDNILLMEFIGDEQLAPQVKNQKPKDPKDFFNKVVQSMQQLYRAGLVHGDLSAYNILNWNEQPVFIDFSQGTTVKSPHARELLERDVKNVCTFFRKLTPVDEKEVLQNILKKKEEKS